MKNNRGIAPLIVVLIVAGVLVLGGGGYYAVKKYKTPAIQPVVGQNQTSTQPTQDETVNWKSYTNSQYGFEVKYPPESEVKWEIVINGSCNSEEYVAKQKTHMPRGLIVSTNKVFLSGISEEVSQLRVEYNNRIGLTTYIPTRDCPASKKMIAVSALDNLLDQYNQSLQTFKFTR